MLKLFIVALNLESILKNLFDSSMTGEQIPAPSSPRDGEDVSMSLERPKVPNYSYACWHVIHESSIAFLLVVLLGLKWYSVIILLSYCSINHYHQRPLYVVYGT